MSLSAKASIVVFGIAIGFMIFLAADMTLTKGTVAAQHIHHDFPECSGPCHG